MYQLKMNIYIYSIRLQNQVIDCNNDHILYQMKIVTEFIAYIDLTSKMR